MAPGAPSRSDSLHVKRLVRFAHAEDLVYVSRSASPVLVELVGEKRSYIGEVFVQTGHDRVVEIRVRKGVACPGRELQLLRNELKVRTGEESVIGIGGGQSGARITRDHRSFPINVCVWHGQFFSLELLVVVSQAQRHPVMRPPAHIRSGRPASIALDTKGRVEKIVVIDREIE